MKKLLSVSLVLIMILLLNTNCDKKDNDIINTHLCNNTNTTNILLIGNSLFGFNSTSEILRQVSEAAGKDVFIDTRIVGGSSLDFHSTSDMTDAKIFEKGWDYVILQGTGRRTTYSGDINKMPKSKEIISFPGLKALHKIVTDKCGLTKVIFAMPWAYEDGMKWADGSVDSYEIMQEKIYNCTMEFADEIDLMIAPVGHVWQEVIEGQTTPHYLHNADLVHPSIGGTFLMAYVLFSTIFQESSEGNSYRNFISQEEIYYFQKVASEIVLNNLDLWHIK